MSDEHARPAEGAEGEAHDEVKQRRRNKSTKVFLGEGSGWVG